MPQTVKVKRHIIASTKFKETITRLQDNVLKLDNAKVVLAWANIFGQNHADFLVLYKKYQELGEEGKEQLHELLNEEVELPVLNKCVFKDPKLELSASDLLLLEFVTGEKI